LPENHETGGRSEPSDLDLVRGIAEGRDESFVLLFRRWAPRLGGFLFRATGSREVADDLLQETFLRVFRSAARFEPRGNVAAWLYRIGANLAYSHWRHCQVRAALEADLDEAATRSFGPAALGPENLRECRALEEAAAEALARIPANQRLVFILKVDQGLTYEEIAAVLDCPVGTTKSRFHWAVHRLRDELKDWKDAEEKEVHPDAVRQQLG
jgi:RNA polymerase sigma-70 factor, ECF subfamily